MTCGPTIFAAQEGLWLPGLDWACADAGEILQLVLARVERQLREELARRRPDVQFNPRCAHVRVTMEYLVPDLDGSGDD